LGGERGSLGKVEEVMGSSWSKRLRRVARGAVVFTVGVAALASAQTETRFEITPYHWSLASRTTTTEVSGVAGTAIPVLRSSASRIGVVGVGFAHASTTGDTVQVGLQYRRQNGDSGEFMMPMLPTCGTAVTCSGSTASGTRWVTPATVDNDFVTGLAVCTDGNASTTNVSIRGVRLEYGRVAANGTITTVSPTEEQSVGGCSTWHPMQRCAAGSIAVNVVAQLQGTVATARRYRGLALECAAVQPPPTHPARTHEFAIDTSANVTVAGVIGTQGARQRLIGGDGVFQGLYEMDARNQTGGICGGGLVMRELSNGGRTEAGAALENLPHFPACTQIAGQARLSLSHSFVEAPQDKYIVGFARSHGNANDGWWIYAQLGPRGGRQALERLPTPDRTIARIRPPGVTEVTCPDEHVVTGLSMHTQDNKYTGFQLVCSPVRAPAAVPVPTRPGR
jgi:hypothetical protein